MVVPTRDLKAMMATIPDFSGEEDKEMASWLDFYIAVTRNKKLTSIVKKMSLTSS